MKIIRADRNSGSQGKPFTGEVVLTPLLKAQLEGGLQLTLVAFQDGARTYWHRHPGEQALYILEGVGRVGAESGEVVTVGPGDVVYARPGEKHWHGAAPGRSMTHLSVTTVGSPEWFGPPEG